MKTCRYLRHLGYEVTYVRNFTDVDDKVRMNTMSLVPVFCCLNITLYLVVTRTRNSLIVRPFHHPAAIFVAMNLFWFFFLLIFILLSFARLWLFVSLTYMSIWILNDHNRIWNYMNVYYQRDIDWNKVCVPSLKSGSIYGSSHSWSVWYGCKKGLYYK